jgi:D-arabinose 1-dehydrogenase-like Zn-dependent alcohol dehydrogenase
MPIALRIGTHEDQLSKRNPAMPTFHAYAANTVHGPLLPFEFDPGEIGDEEVEIKVSHCGICHSDLSMLDNEWGMSAYPFVPGHEAVGTVVALGEGAKGLEIGQRVGVGWFAYSCLSCRECLAGNYNLCARAQGTIVGRHGAFADRVRVQWTWVRPLPESLVSEKTGPLLCGGITVFTPFLEYRTPSHRASRCHWHRRSRAHGAAICQQVGLRSARLHDQRRQARGSTEARRTLRAQYETGRCAEKISRKP